ncbi:hypothetical protein GCM10022393_00800 [Aquimarina addita]|uniref:Lipoprotein n=1 Tax=Aquimarina addita TaxID=870485 RepID=A0ABP7X7Y7_9FLAO
MKKILLIIFAIALFSCKNEGETKEKQNTNQTSVIPLKRPDIKSSMVANLADKLSPEESNTLFTKRRKKELSIDYRHLDVYTYEDIEGTHYLVNSKHILSEEKDTLYDKMKLFDLRYKDKQFKKRFTVKDNIDSAWETSIWLWTTYSEIDDFDGDGLTDLILVYGTTGQDMYVDGKVRIVIYSKKKTTIRHQNSDLDDGRITKIKASFYVLPSEIQDVVKEKMRLMMENGHARFAANWEKEMANKSYNILEK